MPKLHLVKDGKLNKRNFLKRPKMITGPQPQRDPGNTDEVWTLLLSLYGLF